jgi:hypothetical protein
MVRPSSQNAYSQSAGLAGILAPVQEARDPTSLDVNYVLYREWINTSNDNYWKLMSFDSTSGTVLANWMQLEGTTNEVQTLTGDSGGAVGPTANNINILGTAGQITVTGNPATSTLTLALSGGGTAIDSFIPDSGTSPVVPTAAGAVTMTGGNGIATVGGTNQLTFDMESPFTGDFTFRSTTSGDTETLTVTNTSDTASSQAQINAVVAGTSSGDAWNQWTVGSTRSYSLGIDTSTTNRSFKFNTNSSATVNPSTGTEIFNYDPSTDFFIFTTNVLYNQTSLVGSALQLGVNNTDTSNTSSSSRVTITVDAATAGDSYLLIDNTGSNNYVVGLDNSDSDKFKIQHNTNTSLPLMNGTDLIIIDPVGSPAGTPSMQFNTSEFFVRANNGAEVVNLTVRQENAADFADIIAEAVGPKSGFFSSGIYDNSSSPIYWNFGCSATDASLGNAYCLNTSNSTQGPEGGTRIWRANPTGEITMPLQPAFFGYLDSSTPNDVTGDGTVYTVGFNQEVFDQGSDFNPATGTFTVPVTGKYKFTANVLLANLGAAHTAGDISINVAGATAYQFASSLCNPGAGRNPTNQYSMQVTAFASLTAGDTVTVRVNVSNGGKTVGVFGSASPQFWTYFDGSLFC